MLQKGEKNQTPVYNNMKNIERINKLTLGNWSVYNIFEKKQKPAITKHYGT